MERYKKYKEAFPNKTDAQCIESLCWEVSDKVETIHKLLHDMADKKYTEEDMIKFAFDTYCYISGIMKVPFNQVSENRTHAEDNLKVFINSLNKQD